MSIEKDIKDIIEFNAQARCGRIIDADKVLVKKLANYVKRLVKINKP